MAGDAAAALGKRLARVPVGVRWGDLDAFNHVNNARFLDLVQEARLVWMAALDGEWMSDAFKPVLAATQMNYRRQLGWPADIVVELGVQRLGNSSLTIAHRIVAADDDAMLYADGHVVLVWIAPDSGRSLPLPPAVRRACS
ncbi:MAG: thioesterase [Lysobacterales bacterium 69-70]|nr:acyl-CoA thioesterase [Xanthomonadaceae bacterium]ODU36064.1 MAG: thioesterase [Xanthomonadaceae bacterium SCN 69-320]ODV18193.1 MAG: thioesterase [Xanthomonadaceae bacterium SCN 69-25]OJY99476.1 MAG: thioesterase [Xanthomonadales bacterium 69-70]